MIDEEEAFPLRPMTQINNNTYTAPGGVAATTAITLFGSSEVYHFSDFRENLSVRDDEEIYEPGLVELFSGSRHGDGGMGNAYKISQIASNH